MSVQAPFTPADCDLRGMPYMPLYGDRLFGSATWIGATAEAKVAALRLWWRSFAHEVPAASLPDDDTLLADYSGYGIGVKAWRKVKPQAMRGWVKCSDGRLYHHTVAEVALEAWEQRKRNREKQERWRSKNRSVTTVLPLPVTVTDGVTEPLCNAGSEVKGEGREESNSEAKASGAKAPMREVIFQEGLPWLMRRSGLDDRACRGIIGKWLKEYGDEPVLAAIQQAEQENPVDPVPWIVAKFKPRETHEQRRLREIREVLQ